MYEMYRKKVERMQITHAHVAETQYLLLRHLHAMPLHRMLKKVWPIVSCLIPRQMLPLILQEEISSCLHVASFHRSLYDSLYPAQVQ